ncbi:MAG TPA: TonB-dependent receptor [Chitinophagaceae bacterium]|nr:TonB-dependent receptor [Chitinophagaceae bacterium]
MKKIVYTLLASALAQGLLAQTDTTANQLNPVIVTANKFEQKQQETGKVLTVITQEQLRRNSGRTLGDVLNEQTGIFINGTDNDLGSNESISLRGASSANTLILIDGVPVYDASGITSEFDISYLNINQIDHIEILKGAQSTLYGSDAVAGVINIITKKKGVKPLGGYASLAGGSYGTINGAAGINGNSKGWQYNLGYTYLHDKGFSSAYDSTGKAGFDNDGYTQHSINASIGYDAGKGFNIRAYTHYTQFKAGLDEGAFTDDNNYNLNDKNLQLGAAAVYKLGKNKLFLNYQYNKLNRSYVDDSSEYYGAVVYQSGMYKGFSHFAELYGNFSISPKAELVAGVDYRHNSTDQSSHFIYAGTDYPSAPLSKGMAETSQAGAYASFIVRDVSGFTFEFGGRVNNHSVYGWNGTYSINPSYKINNNWKLYANIASAYRVPSLYQLYSEYGNKDLKPEQSQSYEGGIQFASKVFTARATVFKRNIQDVIYFYTDPQTYASQYINADKQDDNGFELEAQANISKAFSVSANYTYTDGTLHTTSDFTGKDTALFNHYRVPRNLFNLQVNIQPLQQLYFGIHVRAVSGHEEPAYMAPPFKVSGYYTLDLHVQYEANKQLQLFADFMNVTNQQYFDIRGYNSKRFNFIGGIRVQL